MAIIAPDRAVQRRARPVVYPTSDGKPMGETDRHIDLTMYVKQALMAYFADRPDVYVAANNFLYYQEGDPKQCVSPDGYVVFGVQMRQRDCYKAWEEGGKLPAVVFEFTSRETRREDTDTKRPRYEQVLKVPEYFLFDPTGDYLKPRLQGFRPVEGRYVPIPQVGGRMRSEQLGLELVQEGETLVLCDPATGERLPGFMEQTRRAEQEARRAEEEARRAEQEARRAENAEAEVERLRKELEALRRGNP